MENQIEEDNLTPNNISDELQDFISKPPKYLVRWGITVILLLFIIFILISWFIRYPEVVTGRAIITSVNPPSYIISRTSGRITKLMVDDKIDLEAGDIIAEMENVTKYENIPSLLIFLKNMKIFLKKNNYKFTPPLPNVTFGDLQVEFNSILKNYNELNRLLNDSSYHYRETLLKKQINDYNRLNVINKRELYFNSQELKNVKEKYEGDKKLYKDKVYGKFDFYNLENEYFQKLKQNESYGKTIIENSLRISDLNKELSNLQNDFYQRSNALRDGIVFSIFNVENLLSTWRQTFLITSPIKGQLNYLYPFHNNDFIRTGDTLFNITSFNNKLICQMKVSSKGVGKIVKGQRVIIKLDGYPYHEYGSINGEVDRVALTPNQNFYRVSVLLPNNLNTSFKPIPLSFTKSEFIGNGEIVINDYNLVQRILFTFRDLNGN